MNLYDISLTIHNGMVVWPGDPQVILERVSKIEEGQNANVSRLEMSVHTGTHLDAPHHFIHGARTIETLPLDVLIGPAQVVQIPDNVGVITAREVADAGIGSGVTRLLFKTRNSAFWLKKNQVFEANFVGVTQDGAEELVRRGIRLVGIDYLSIAPFKASRPTHEVLLRSAMIILEGLDLNGVPAGMYTLVCLPPKLGGSDGAPARAVLLDNL